MRPKTAAALHELPSDEMHRRGKEISFDPQKKGKKRAKKIGKGRKQKMKKQKKTIFSRGPTRGGPRRASGASERRSEGFPPKT